MTIKLWTPGTRSDTDKNGEGVEKLATFKFPGTHISEDITRSYRTNCLVRKAQQRLPFLTTPRRVNLPHYLLLSSYHCSAESILTYGILVCYDSSSTADKNGLAESHQDRTINNGHTTLRPTSRCLRMAKNTLKDTSHPAHHLFELLPSDRCYRTVQDCPSQDL